MPRGLRPARSSTAAILACIVVPAMSAAAAVLKDDAGKRVSYPWNKVYYNAQSRAHSQSMTAGMTVYWPEPNAKGATAGLTPTSFGGGSTVCSNSQVVVNVQYGRSGSTRVLNVSDENVAPAVCPTPGAQSFGKTKITLSHHRTVGGTLDGGSALNGQANTPWCAVNLYLSRTTITVAAGSFRKSPRGNCGTARLVAAQLHKIRRP